MSQKAGRHVGHDTVGLVLAVVGPALFWAWDYACFSTTLLLRAAGSGAPSPFTSAAFLVSQASVLMAAWALHRYPEKTPGIMSTSSVMVSSVLLGLFCALLMFMRPSSAAEGALLVVAAIAAGGALPPLAIAWGARQTLCHRALMPVVAASFLCANLFFALLVALPRSMVALACALPVVSAALWAFDGRRRRRLDEASGGADDLAEGHAHESVDGDAGSEFLPWSTLLSLAALSFLCEVAVRATEQGAAGTPSAGTAFCLLFCLALLLLSARSGRLGRHFAPEMALYALIPIAAASLVALPYAGTAADIARQLLHGMTIAVQTALWMSIADATEHHGLSPVSSFGVGLVTVSAATLAGEVCVGVLGAVAPGALSSWASPIAVVLLVAMTSALAWTNARHAPKGQPSSPASETFEGTLATWQEAVDERMGLFAEQYGLTPREREVFGHLLEGSTAPHIGELMGLTTGTVKSHIIHIYRKLGVNARQQAVDLFKSFEAR